MSERVPETLFATELVADCSFFGSVALVGNASVFVTLKLNAGTVVGGVVTGPESLLPRLDSRKNTPTPTRTMTVGTITNAGGILPLAR
jgi:hypothetical protein